ncbi:MAG: replication protein P [Gammaproteobacteria bacterium]|nr:replication protein P [Gammaproteobacteria bacterium]
MPDSNDLIQQVARDLEASQTTSPTAAGPSREISEQQIDTINQVFALFRLNYHNQFYAAYPDNEQLNQVKKLWLDALASFPTAQVLRGAKHTIETSEYLPTLNKMLECCHQSLRDYGLPDARRAYLEACRAGTPKSAQAWSHAAVYLAGRDADWFFLANNTENLTWPVFRDRYREYCGRIMAGEMLEVPAPEALPAQEHRVSSREQALAELKKIKEKLV